MQLPLAKNLKRNSEELSLGKSGKDIADIIAPPPVIYGGLILLGVLFHWLYPWPVLTSFLKSTSIGGGIIIFGFLLLAWSMAYFIIKRTPVDPYHPTKAIITSGPYRFSRNPVYIALSLIHMGTGIGLQNGWILLLFIPAILIIHHGVIIREEIYLERKFGEAYLTFKNATRRWL